MRSVSPSIVEINQQKLRLAPDVRVWPVRERGETVYRIEIEGQHRFFRVGYRESYLCSLLDGNTTLAQACSLAAAELGRDAPTEKEATEIARWLLDNKIAYLAADHPPVRENELGSSTARPEQQTIWKLLSRLNPFWIKVPIPGGGHAVRALAGALSPLLSGPTVFAGVLLMLSALVGTLTHRELFVQETENIFHPGRWVWMLAIWIALKIVHELGHAIACHRFGGEVSRCGIVFVLLAPLAYVDVSSCWRMPSKLSRIGVSAAGMFVECCIAAAAAWVFLIVDDPLVRSVSHSVVITAGISTLLFNANVLMRFDGYFILADAVDIPNLASEASQTLERFGKRWIIGESSRHGQLSGWRGILVSVYAVAALVWRFGVCVCLAITASTLFEGAGILITAVGIAMWVGRPVARILLYMGFLARHNVVGFYRGVFIGGGLLVAGLAVVFAFPIPSRVRAPVISRYAATSSIRAPANGFVEQIHVRDGQTVLQGTPLITMRNEELRCQLRELKAEHDQVGIEKRQAAGELNEGKTHVLRRHAESLQKQIAQIEERIDSLTIRAPNHGRVIARQLNTLMETYVEEGDEILVVADDTDREWIALITPRNIDRVRTCLGENVRLVSSSQRNFTSRLTRIEPRATDRLIAPALASVHGGPVAIRQDRDESDSDQLRMLQPHFHAWLAVVPDASDLPVGMRMFVDCGYRSQTIASRLREWVRSVYEAHLAVSQSA